MNSRVTVRGFGTSNVGVMINGVPMNDMEWGGIYWSNWAGLSDVTRSMQVQRGLGASKLSSPSVGGSINVITNSTDAQKGGTLSYGMGNDGYNKVLFSLSSGLTKDGWAFSVLGSKTWVTDISKDVSLTHIPGLLIYPSVSVTVILCL